MAKVLQCIYKSWPCDDLDQVYGKVNMGCLCIWIGKTVKMSFEGKSQQEIGKWTEYWRFWKKKMAQGLICPCTGVKYHNIQTCLLVYAADLRWAFTGPLVLWFFSESLIFSPTAHFLQDFHFKWHFKSFHYSNALATYVDLAIKKGHGHHRVMIYIYTL